MPAVVLSFLFELVFYNRNRYLGPDMPDAKKKMDICQRSLVTETVTHICAVDSEL